MQIIRLNRFRFATSSSPSLAPDSLAAICAQSFHTPLVATPCKSVSDKPHASRAYHKTILISSAAATSLVSAIATNTRRPSIAYLESHADESHAQPANRQHSHPLPAAFSSVRMLLALVAPRPPPSPTVNSSAAICPSCWSAAEYHATVLALFGATNNRPASSVICQANFTCSHVGDFVIV